MPAYTIVITVAAEGAEHAEVNTLTDDFANESEVLGYSRRLAEELVEDSEELKLEFEYSHVGLYEGDVNEEEDLTPDHASFLGLWVLDSDSAEYVTAAEFAEEEAIEVLEDDSEEA